MDRKQIEQAAAANHYLRGLVALPLGIVLIAAALGNMEWGPFRALWLVPVVIVLAGAAYLLIARSYNENYGRVTPKADARSMGRSALAAILMIGVPILVQALDLPVNGVGVAWGAVALGYYVVTVGLHAHHVAIWGVVLVVSLVPLWGDPRTTNAPNVGLLMIGVAMVATGVFDHRLLVETFGPAGGLDVEGTRAGA
jgi:heme/copper-type cytochrome/quinol oxidase subunit 3